MILYTRKDRPICYETPVLGKETQISALPGQLLSSGLGWCWESERTDGVASDWAHLGLPDKRQMTELTAENTALLQNDLRERNVDDYGRAIGIFGGDPEAISTLLDEATFRAALAAFSHREEGPIRIVIVQIGDSPVDDIFVPNQPCERVRKLLETWNIGPHTVRKTRRYPKGRLLEAIYELPDIERGSTLAKIWKLVKRA